MEYKITDMPPKVSVIIPIYNAGDCLERCLNSVLQQTLCDIEIVCVLDCPTDGSDAIVKEFAKADNRIRIIENKENQHIGCSRNIGLSHAQGEYVAFCDDDDLMENNFIKTMLAEAERTHSFIVASYDSYYQEPESPHSIDCNTKDAFLDVFSGKAGIYSPSVWTYLYRRDFLVTHQIEFVDTRRVSIEDKLFVTTVLAHAIRDGISTFPLVQQHLYVHAIEHTNSKYSYRKPEKILAMLEQMGNIDLIVENNTSISQYLTPYTECIAIMLYGSLRQELRQNGIKSCIKKMYLVKEYPNIRSSLIENHVPYNKRLTLPKNILLFILRKMVS